MTKNESVMIYLGPTIRGVVKHGAAFRSGLPRQLEDYCGKNPIIKNLIVPTSEITETMKAVSVEGTVENIAYRRLSK